MMLDHDTLYAALSARDSRFEGQAWAAVRTTGIFCRLTCPARTARRENVRFLPSVAACLEAGFRPCKRCKPCDPPTSPRG
jgi:AraC family transcriptional regulator of adaptative response/methylated-DNA-[protein]-cysteine methyltransferase